MPADADQQRAEELRQQGEPREAPRGGAAAGRQAERELARREGRERPDDRRDVDLRQAEVPAQHRQRRRQHDRQRPGVVEGDLVPAQRLESRGAVDGGLGHGAFFSGYTPATGVSMPLPLKTLALRCGSAVTRPDAVARSSTRSAAPWFCSTWLRSTTAAPPIATIASPAVPLMVLSQMTGTPASPVTMATMPAPLWVSSLCSMVTPLSRAMMAVAVLSARVLWARCTERPEVTEMAVPRVARISLSSMRTSPPSTRTAESWLPVK